MGIDFTYRRFARIESTHRYLMQNGDNFPHGTIVVADFQEQGRGRLGRTWISPEGTSLLFSMLLKPEIQGAQISQLCHVMSLACAEALKCLGVSTLIKWPNDLTINGNKIAGLLSEASFDNTAVKFAVLSAGINLNQTTEDLSKIERPATSCFIETGKKYDKVEVLNTITEEFSKYYSIFCSNGFGQMKSEWENLSCLKNRRIAIDLGNRLIEGTVKGFTDEGSILLENEDGIKGFCYGEVTRIMERSL